MLTDGSVAVTRDIGRPRPPPLAAWWTGPAQALALKRYCTKNDTADVTGAAATLRIGLTPHAVAVDIFPRGDDSDELAAAERAPLRNAT